MEPKSTKKNISSVIPSNYGEIPIVYEDNHLLVVNKPTGLLSQGDETGDPDLLSLLKKYLKEKYQKPGNVFLALVQRLDRGTSGLMVFARTSKAASRISEQIRARRVEKRYLAVVLSDKISTGVFTHYLKKDKDRRKALVSDHSLDRYQKSVLELQHLETVEKRSLVSIILETGRYHQIRAQLSHLGMPICGDRKYGAPRSSGSNPALICNQLDIRHPTQNHVMSFSVQPPSTEPWKHFTFHS